MTAVPLIPKTIAQRAILLIPLLLAGCGADEYERRLAHTSILYEHLDQLNSNLEGEWTDPDAGVRLRVPRKFALIPAPGPRQASPGGGPAAPAVDERQPTFLNVELPGLRGAFSASVSALGANRARVSAKARLYVLCNVGIGENPAQFHEDVVEQVCRGAGIARPVPDAWRREQFPLRQDQFVRQVEYMVATPTDLVVIDGIATQVTFDVFHQDNAVVVLVWLTPHEIESSERLPARMDLCRETLKVNPPSDSPSAPVGGGAADRGF